jgi:transposase
MPESSLIKFFILPELKFIRSEGVSRIFCEKSSPFEVCPRCATPSHSVYDHRWVKLKDAPIRQMNPILVILKRRFYCKPCERPFTEPVPGVLPGKRTTQRFKLALLEASEKFHSMKLVREEFKVSSDFVYRARYEQLQLRERERQYHHWPEKIGIDEHSIGKDPIYGRTRFVSLLVNQKRGRLMEVIQGKSTLDVIEQTRYLQNPQNVKWVTQDMYEGYRKFVYQTLPQARIIVDKFHVLKLLTPYILKERRRIVGTNATRKARSFLLMSAHKLDYFDRLAIRQYLASYPELSELYSFKEMLHSFYRIKNPKQAHDALDSIILAAQKAKTKEVKRLGKTLKNWRNEILNYFDNRMTNARLEGFNNKASLVRKRGYGYKNIENYRLQLLNACS